MHASIADLLKLRDGEPVAAEVRAHVDGCAGCAGRLQWFVDTLEHMRALPPQQPPADVWARIEAEAYDGRPAPVDLGRRPRRWRVAGIAAALLATVGATAWMTLNGRADRMPVAPPIATAPAAEPVTLMKLQRESSRLEAALRNLRRHDAMMTARTANTIATLEDGIALIDYRLNQGSAHGLAPREAKRLWRQRVGLMRSLVTVRYVQASTPSVPGDYR